MHIKIDCHSINTDVTRYTNFYGLELITNENIIFEQKNRSLILLRK